MIRGAAVLALGVGACWTGEPVPATAPAPPAPRQPRVTKRHVTKVPDETADRKTQLDRFAETLRREGPTELPPLVWGPVVVLDMDTGRSRARRCWSQEDRAAQGRAASQTAGARSPASGACRAAHARADRASQSRHLRDRPQGPGPLPRARRFPHRPRVDPEHARALARRGRESRGGAIASTGRTARSRRGCSIRSRRRCRSPAGRGGSVPGRATIRCRCRRRVRHSCAPAGNTTAASRRSRSPARSNDSRPPERGAPRGHHRGCGRGSDSGNKSAVFVRVARTPRALHVALTRRRKARALAKGRALSLQERDRDAIPALVLLAGAELVDRAVAFEVGADRGA